MNTLIEFDSHPLNLLIIDGRPALLARQVGAAIGYSDGGASFAEQVTEQWGDEFIEGRDYQVATQAELSAALAKTGNRPVLSPRGALVLFESGVYLGCLLSKKEAGRRLRRKLADEVMPQLARDGHYAPSRQSLDDGRLSEPASPPPLSQSSRDDEDARLQRRLTMARELIATLPEREQLVATRALLKVVVPGLELPEGPNYPADARQRAASILRDPMEMVRSNRQLEELHGISRETFRTVRAELEAAGLIPTLDRVIDTRDRSQPAHRAPVTPETRSDGPSVRLAPDLRELFIDWLRSQLPPVYLGRAARAVFGRGRVLDRAEVDQVAAEMTAEGWTRFRGYNSHGKAVYSWWPPGQQPVNKVPLAWPAGLPLDWRGLAQRLERPWTEEDIERDRLWWEYRLDTRFIRRRPGRRALQKRWGWTETATRAALVRWGWCKS